MCIEGLVLSSLQASAPIWASEASRARKSEPAAKPRGEGEKRASSIRGYLGEQKWGDIGDIGDTGKNQYHQQVSQVNLVFVL